MRSASRSAASASGLLEGADHDIERDAAARASREGFGVEQPAGALAGLWIDRHREHDGAIAIVDDKRRRDRFTCGIVEPCEAHLALLAELERGLFEQRGGFVVGERRRFIALRPLQPRQPAQRAHALAQRTEIIAKRGDDARGIGRICGRERECDPRGAACRRRALDREAARRETLHEVRTHARRIGERFQIHEIPARRIVDQRLRERGAGAVVPAGTREKIEPRRTRAGIAHHAQLPRVEHRDLDGAAIERRHADDVAGAQARGLVLRGAADQHVKLGVERVVVGVPPRISQSGPRNKAPGVVPARVRHSASRARSASRSRTTWTSIAIRRSNVSRADVLPLSTPVADDVARSLPRAPSNRSIRPGMHARCPPGRNRALSESPLSLAKRACEKTVGRMFVRRDRERFTARDVFSACGEHVRERQRVARQRLATRSFSSESKLHVA